MTVLHETVTIKNYSYTINNLSPKQDHNRTEKLIGVAPPLPSTVEDRSENINEV